MKKCCGSMLVVLFVVAVLASGCNCMRGTPVSDLERLQGTWVGSEVGWGGEVSVVFADDTIHFTGAHPQEWYKGTGVLNEDATPKEADFTISECPAPQYVGKVAKAIYKIEGETLTMVGSEPGTEPRPTSFEAFGGTRVFEFTRAASNQP